MDSRAQTPPLWEHTCCQTRCWSATRMCDRCGAQAAFSIVGVSTVEAMAHLHSLERRRFETQSASCFQEASIHPGLERALGFGLWLFSGLGCAFMVIGAVAEFE